MRTWCIARSVFCWFMGQGWGKWVRYVVWWLGLPFPYQFHLVYNHGNPYWYLTWTAGRRDIPWARG